MDIRSDPSRPVAGSSDTTREPGRHHRAPERADEISIHILTVSATLVGVCLTVIGVLSAVDRLRPAGTYADELLSLDAVGFLVACTYSYAALRTRDRERRRALERTADRIFLTALTLMTGVALVITFALL